MTLLLSGLPVITLTQAVGVRSSFSHCVTALPSSEEYRAGLYIPEIKQIPNASLRIYANAYNLLTFTGVKFVDPEHPDDDLGRMYPLNKTYTW